MKQGGIAAWNIAPLFKGNAVPCPHPFHGPCTLPRAPGTLTVPQLPAACWGWQHPAHALPAPLHLARVPLPPCAAAKDGSCLHLCPMAPCAPLPALPAPMAPCLHAAGSWVAAGSPPQRYLAGSPWSCAMLPAVPTLSCPVLSCLGLPASLSYSHQLSPVLSRAASFPCPLPVSFLSSPIPTTPHNPRHAGCQMPTGACGL